LDPKFALAWALLSFVNSRAYGTQSLQPTVALREEARQAAETALTLQPNLGEALHAKGYYHYACLKDYDTRCVTLSKHVRSYRISAGFQNRWLMLHGRRGQWDRSESHFNEAEQLDPRNAYLITQHAVNYICLRRFPEALRKLDEVLTYTGRPGYPCIKGGYRTSEGDLPAGLGAPSSAPSSGRRLQRVANTSLSSHLGAPPCTNDLSAKGDIDQARSSVGYFNGDLRLWLGWRRKSRAPCLPPSKVGDRRAANLNLFLRTAGNEFSH